MSVHSFSFYNRCKQNPLSRYICYHGLLRWSIDVRHQSQPSFNQYHCIAAVHVELQQRTYAILGISKNIFAGYWFSDARPRGPCVVRRFCDEKWPRIIQSITRGVGWCHGLYHGKFPNINLSLAVCN